MCIIEKGSIQIFLDDKSPKQQLEQMIKEIGPGSSFGVFGFLSGVRGHEKFRSVGFTKLLLISRDDMLEAIKDFPEDKEKLCTLKDDILFNNGYETAKLLK
jgi:CRP-like cAMP-binding protein